MIHIHSRHTPHPKLEKKYRGARIVDVTSRGPSPWVRLSPFFPVGDLPIPGRPGEVGASVEGIWQGLKVFETADVDPKRFDITTMKGLKRTVRKFGPCLGHAWGPGPRGTRLLGYREARYQIFLPLYRTVLADRCADVIAELASIARDEDLLLLDYMTNPDVDDLSKPLSHAGLIAAWLEDRWPGRE